MLNISKILFILVAVVSPIVVSAAPIPHLDGLIIRQDTSTASSGNDTTTTTTSGDDTGSTGPVVPSGARIPSIPSPPTPPTPNVRTGSSAGRDGAFRIPPASGDGSTSGNDTTTGDDSATPSSDNTTTTTDGDATPTDPEDDCCVECRC